MENHGSFGKCESLLHVGSITPPEKQKRKYAWRKRIAEFRTTETESGEEYLKNRLPSAEEQILEEVLPKKGWRIWCWKLLS